MEQRTEEWFKARLGKVTASRVSDILSSGVTRKSYLYDLITERMTGERKEIPVTKAMQWGIDTEPEARLAYEIYTGNDVIETGFVNHPFISEAGASPDGLVDRNGLIEIKSPNSKTHIETVIDSKINSKYIYQMQWQMACTEKEWCDFISYDPRVKNNELFIKRIERDDKLIEEMEIKVQEFLNDIDKMLIKYNTLSRA